MCLYPILIDNPKYKPNKKNKGKPPKCTDERLLKIPAACGECYECRKQKSREWLIRMTEELKANPIAWFMNFSISDETFKDIKKRYKIKDDNNVARQCIRLLS